MSDNDIGMIGLAVMGRNLALNMADKGFGVAVYNRTESVTREFISGLEPGQQLQACFSLEELVGSLKRPRKVMMMVHAGAPVDAVIAGLQPLLEPGDVLIDGGNSNFRDTDRRAGALEATGIHFLGVGISGGEYGARNGPSIMPGGPKEAYPLVQKVFEAVAARAEGVPCVSYLGPGAAGHYVKMVHNGIEYGIMQVISESYALMKLALGLSNERLAEIYAQWNAAELESYLVEITAEIFRRRDGETAGFLIDLIKGEAEQLGTGMWASQSAMDLHVPVPGIDIAVAMRNVSGTERPPVDTPPGKSGTGVTEGGAPTTTAGLTPEHVRRALHAAVILTYVQGFAQLSAASAAYGFGLKLAEVATVWRGGCIIRSGLLRDFKTAFEGRGESADLRLDPRLSDEVRSRRSDLVRTVEAGMSDRIPVPGLMAALGYLDAYSAEWLPTNLIQAQRDYFGAHTYRRLDRDGVFHTDWSDSGPPADGGTRAADAPAATAGS